MTSKWAWTLAVALGSCASPAMAQVRPVGPVWVAEMLGDTPFAQTSRPTLRFGRNGDVTGNAGCNRFSGTAQIDGNQISISPLRMTQRTCFGAADVNERLFAPIVGTVSMWRSERGMLVLTTAGGALRLRRR